MVWIFFYISVILLTSDRFTFLPSPTSSLQTKPGTNSWTRKQHTGSALVVAASYPQHWGFLSVFYTSASVHSALPLSFRCSARLLSWPFSAVWGHLFLTFLAGSYPTSFFDQSLLCRPDWWSDSQLCPVLDLYVHLTSNSLSDCRPAVQPRPRFLQFFTLPAPASRPSSCWATPAPPQFLWWHMMRSCGRLFDSWLL